MTSSPDRAVQIASSSSPRLLARLAALAGCVVAVTVCGEQGRFQTTSPAGPSGDTESPVASIVFPGGPADTIVDITDSLKFTVRVTDNIRIASVKVEVAGLNNFPLDTVVLDSTPSGTVTALTKAFAIPLPTNTAGQRLNITVTAQDGSSNTGSASANVTVDDRQPPLISVFAPASGITAPNGGTLIVVAKASDPSGIRRMGARIFFLNALQLPVAISGDSLTYSLRFTTRQDTFRVKIPNTLAPGSYPVHVFAVDSSANANTSTSSSISITVADTLKPFGGFILPVRNASVVAGDSVIVRFRSQDSTGVVSVTLDGVSHRGVDSLGTGVDVTRFNAVTVTLPNRNSDTTLTRILSAVASDSTPETVFLRAVLTDVSNNTTTVKDTIVIVPGPFVRVGNPASGARLPVGVPVSIKIVGRDPDSVRTLGFVATGVATGRDSVVRSSPLKITDSVTTLSLAVSATARLGVDTITPFATDRLGSRFVGLPVVISFQDTVAPTDTIKTPAANVLVAVGDSVLLTVRVLDNRGVSSLTLLGVAYRGSRAFGTDTSVTRLTPRAVTLPQSTDTTITRYLRAVLTDSTPETVYLIAQLQDSSGNSRRDSIAVTIVNGPKTAILRPADSSLTSPGKFVAVQIRGISKVGVRLLGWAATGAVAKRDSVIASPTGGTLADTLVFNDSLLVPNGTPAGSVSITAFATDSLGNPSGLSSGVTILVQTVSTDVTPPLVQFTIGTRVEAADSVTVHATDAGGIKRLGFIVRRLGTPSAPDTTIVKRDSLAGLPGTQTDVTQRFSIGLDTITSFPRQLTIEAFAFDSIGNRGVSTLTSVPRATPAARETLTVVAGKTIALPPGSKIGDAIFNANRNELYLTNTALDRLEVFSLASNSFVASIPVGSRPVGIALWPHDTLGTYGDTVIVANTGGTNLSVVDVAARVERRRQRLPTYTLFTVKTQTNSGGGTDVLFTSFGFSSRPFQLGATCITSVKKLATCDMVRAVYSSTPTPAQSIANRGYMAWIDLNPGANPGPHVHFIYEHANDIEPTDTIQIEAAFDSLPGQPLREIVLGAGVGVRTKVENLIFQDSTFVRNSGDFRHVIVGEGGPAAFARVLTYDARRGLGQHAPLGTGKCVVGTVVLDCTGTLDTAVSQVEFVSDFVINRSSRVSAVATNFNGRTNVVRADSIYAFDFILRQTGIMQIGGQAVGLDFHPSNNFDAETRGTGGAGFGGTGSPNNRLVFAARPDSSIDVFDTYFYGRVTDTTSVASTIPIPIRNALIGPVRVATVSGKTVMFGITASGLVTIQLPSVTNSLFPIRLPTTTSSQPTGPENRPVSRTP